ncbi:MAG: T9SS type A sorting domain-containing protein [Chitinophagales bacterium]
MIKLSPRLEKQLRSYSLFAGSVLASCAAKAQVIYHDIVPDVILSRTSQSLPFDTLYALDLNADSITDFIIYLRSYTTSGNSQVLYSEGIQPQSFNNVAVRSQQSFLPFQFEDCETVDTINAGASWTSSYGAFNIYTYSSPYGVGKVNDFFVGLRFDLNSNFRYGWVRMDINPDSGRSLVIKDYAYETIPNSGIKAGCMVGIEELHNELMVAPNPSGGKIVLSASNILAGKFRLSVIDMIGIEVYSQDVIAGRNKQINLDLAWLETGAYLISLENASHRVMCKWLKQ